MKTKQCRNCGETKSLDDFHKDGKKSSKDGRHSYCKTCSIEKAKAAYRRQTPERKAELKQQALEKKRAMYEICNTIKDKHGCQKCPEKDPCCLDFHHLDPSDKDKEVSWLAAHKNYQRMIDEINKCVVVCTNCHRKIHAGKLNTEGLLPCEEEYDPKWMVHKRRPHGVTGST